MLINVYVNYYVNRIYLFFADLPGGDSSVG